MWTLIFSNWRLFAKAAGYVAVFMAGYYVSSQFAEGRLKRALEAQQTALEQQCKDDKAITEGGNNELQKKYNAIAAKLKRVQSAHCIVPATGETQPSTSGGGHAGKNGLSTNWLGEYAAECERYRQERLTLEQFEAEVWKAKNQ